MRNIGPGRADEIGRWSEQKLELLEKYLKAYSVVMNGQKTSWLKEYHYIDAFAGSVKPKMKDTGEYIAGSPLRALEATPPFDVYWFIELSPWRLQQLENLRAQFPTRTMRIRQKDCNEVLRNEVVTELTYASKKRGLVFLDPYGLQVEWNTIKALAKARTLDIFVNFPLMGITRLLKRDELPGKNALAILNRVMGSSDWIEQIYQPSLQMSFIDEGSISRDVMRAEWLARVYANQLDQLFSFVSEPAIMTNTRNAALYALFLASHNKKAAKNIGNDIISGYQRLREIGR